MRKGPVLTGNAQKLAETGFPLRYENTAEFLWVPVEEQVWDFWFERQRGQRPLSHSAVQLTSDNVQ